MSDSTVASQSDHLHRAKFLGALESNVQALAEVPRARLSTPRAIAVDAKWGNGKTWVATELSRRIAAGTDSQPVALIDVFRYDHHDDPFAVIASAIYDVLKPTGAKKRTFLAAAGKVLQSAAPVAARAAITLGARAIGLNGEDQDELKKNVLEGVADGAGTLSEKAIEKLFDSYSKTEQIQNRFMETLGALTSELQKPLVVIIDELDRCRPSFALEVLERIKHLFDAENVVFVLFWNSTSIHESIRHTYGRRTNAEDYLAKFVAFSVPLEMPKPRASRLGSRYDNFIRAIAEEHFPGKVDSYDFREGLRMASGVLEPTLRQLQRAVQLAAQTKAYNDEWPSLAAYLFLLKSVNEVRVIKLLQLDQPTASEAAADFEKHLSPEQDGQIYRLYSIFTFIANIQKFTSLATALRTNSTRLEDVGEMDRRVLQETDAGKLIPIFAQHATALFRPLTAN